MASIAGCVNFAGQAAALSDCATTGTVSLAHGGQAYVKPLTIVHCVFRLA